MAIHPGEQQSSGPERMAGRTGGTAYRAGLFLQVLGAAALAVLYPMRSPYYSAGILLFEIGVLVSALTLVVWISWIRKSILAAVLAGIPVQAYGLLAAPPEIAGTVVLAGIGSVCAGAAGMAGKEAYWCAYREGWALLWLFPGMIALNLLAREHIIVNSLGFSLLFLLLLSLAGKKLRRSQPAERAAAPRGPHLT